MQSVQQGGVCVGMDTTQQMLDYLPMLHTLTYACTPCCAPCMRPSPRHGSVCSVSQPAIWSQLELLDVKRQWPVGQRVIRSTNVHMWWRTGRWELADCVSAVENVLANQPWLVSWWTIDITALPHYLTGNHLIFIIQSRIVVCCRMRRLCGTWSTK